MGGMEAYEGQIREEPPGCGALKVKYCLPLSFAQCGGRDPPPFTPKGGWAMSEVWPHSSGHFNPPAPRLKEP